MKHKLRMTLGLAFILLFAFTIPTYGAEDVPRISTEELNNTLENSDLVLLDVRTERDWNKSDIKIIGAIRVDPDDIKSWAGNYSKDQMIVAYCA
jgi:rhodanese-related sulfurtransferase